MLSFRKWICIIKKCGANVKIQMYVLLLPLIKIGDNCEINEHTRIRVNAVIGNNVLTTPNVNLIFNDKTYVLDIMDENIMHYYAVTSPTHFVKIKKIEELLNETIT